MTMCAAEIANAMIPTISENFTSPIKTEITRNGIEGTNVAMSAAIATLAGMFIWALTPRISGGVLRRPLHAVVM